MSKYTTEVRFICENVSGLSESEDDASVEQIVESAIPKIFDFDFPIFDEQYRKVLCTKILMHYYTREIGLETVGLWKLKLRTRLNEVMGYFNQLYNSALLDFNPLYDVNYTRHYERGVDTAGNNSGIDMFSDTPQGALKTDDLFVSEEGATYLTAASKNTGNYSGNTTEGYLETVQGKQGGVSYARMIQDYRKTFINVDMKVIDSLSDLFMNLW